jgi:hypothetical protein
MIDMMICDKDNKITTYEDRRGRCYELALNYLMGGKDEEDLTLVYGTVTDNEGLGDGKHKTLKHAWIEYPDDVERCVDIDEA